MVQVYNYSLFPDHLKKTRCSRGCSTITFVTHWLIHSVILFLQTFKTSLHPNLKSKGAEILRENSCPTMCHISGVMFHVSHVIFSFSFFGQSSEASWWRVCYQRGLPRLVFFMAWPKNSSSAFCCFNCPFCIPTLVDRQYTYFEIYKRSDNDALKSVQGTR